MSLVNKEPVSYLQTDPRWKNVPYAVKGENSTIGGSGCGPTAMAMVLATWADPSVNPKTECMWALSHGYKYLNQGTAYTYFKPAAARYGLECRQITPGYIYGNANSPYHEEAKQALDNGDFVIACMGKGTWTKGGHYVLVWGVEGNIVYINDPASTKLIRTRGNYLVFKQQVKHYWIVKRPKDHPLETVTFKTANYNVKVLDREGLNCRKGPGTNYTVLKVFQHNDVVNVTKESSSGWGQTEYGWINLKNTERTNDMTRQETETLVGKMIDEFEDKLNLPRVYNKESEIPSWYFDAYLKVKPVLKGRDENNLGLSEDLLRTLTLLDRLEIL